ncbi:hypothetical protein Tco_0864163 [Tanacetum coccineum]
MEDGIFFNQSKYIKEMLKKYGLEDSKPMKTPMSSDTKLTKDEECESVDSTKYRGMIAQIKPGALDLSLGCFGGSASGSLVFTMVAAMVDGGGGGEISIDEFCWLREMN